MKPIAFNCLNAPPFQAIGFNYQPTSPYVKEFSDNKQKLRGPTIHPRELDKLKVGQRCKLDPELESDLLSILEPESTYRAFNFNPC